jgi:hypothetical protein
MRLNFLSVIRFKGVIMNHIRQSLIGRWLNFFAMLAFLVLQVPGVAFAASDTKVTHEALKFFVPEKRIRLDAAVVDPKGVTLVRAYFKSKTQADYVFVPMEAHQSAKDSYVANLPAMAKSNDEIQYLFLVVNGANEVLKTEPFVVKAKDSTDVPSWQLVNGDESVQLFTEVPDAPAVAASFSDSVSFNVVESGARFGLVAQIYGTSGSVAVSGAAAGATNAGTAAVATAGLSTATIAMAAAAVAGVAAGGSTGGGGSSGATPVAPPASSIPGTWVGTYTHSTGASGPFTLILSQSGTAVTGSGTTRDPNGAVGTATFNGTASSSSSFSGVSKITSSACTSDVNFSATVTGSQMNATYSSSNCQGVPFTGTWTVQKQ